MQRRGCIDVAAWHVFDNRLLRRTRNGASTRAPHLARNPCSKIKPRPTQCFRRRRTRDARGAAYATLLNFFIEFSTDINRKLRAKK